MKVKGQNACLSEKELNVLLLGAQYKLRYAAVNTNYLICKINEGDRLPFFLGLFDIFLIG